MAEFQYQGVDRAGKKVQGKLNAENEGQLRMALRGMGVRPTKIGKIGALNVDIMAALKGKSGYFPSLQLVLFTRQLQVLISSSVPLVQALDLLAEQAIDRGVKAVVATLKDKVEGGAYLWEALALHPQSFSRLYVALVRAGESSGSVDIMLKRLSRYLEDTERLKKSLKSAAMYPIAVTTVGVAVIGIMITVVIPKFESILVGQGQKLPALTQSLIDLSHFVQSNLLMLCIAFAGAIYGLVKYVQAPEGRSFVQRTLFNAPIAGPLMQKAAMARFCRTMQTLLSSGVNLLDAIEICRNTVDNVVLEQAMAKIRTEVEAGKTLGQTVQRIPVFPRMAVQMIAVGESTGSLDRMLEKVADFYEEDVDAAVAGLSKLIEPILIVVLGGAVAFMLIAMYLPVFQQAGGM